MTSEFENSVINSALWAAAGDALGWITELTTRDGLLSRAALDKVIEPIKWRRIIGGRGGVKVELPAGTYSDDTQLRLSVCRSIRGDGAFDPEVFAKIELPVWTSYALGGGRGSKAAAANLARRDTNWFSNFFEIQGSNYLAGGGNGAAMRVQPHVWCVNPSKKRAYLPDVVRDAIISHGHPHGFCGAALHAMILGATIGRKTTPSIDDIFRCIDNLCEVEDAVAQDQFLDGFWRPTWERLAGTSLHTAVSRVRSEAAENMTSIARIVEEGDLARYSDILERLDCRNREYRGSGLKTTLAAAALLQMSRKEKIEDALIVCVNDLDSDTDTIATMYGAMRGFLEIRPPSWQIQDEEYLRKEGSRLAKIASGERQDSFRYPELVRWEPPSTQSDAVGTTSEGYAIRGLGSIELEGDIYASGDAIWQWGRLPFGQTIFAKRRKKPKVLASSQIPTNDRRPVVDRGSTKASISTARQAQLPLPVVDRKRSTRSPARSERRRAADVFPLYQKILASGFDPMTIGQAMNQCLAGASPFEHSIALAALLAEAASE